MKFRVAYVTIEAWHATGGEVASIEESTLLHGDHAAAVVQLFNAAAAEGHTTRRAILLTDEQAAAISLPVHPQQ